MTALSLLIKEKDEKYKDFSAKIVSDTKYPMIGVRVPNIREIAKTLIVNGDFPLTANGFSYYEECLLFGLTIAGAKIPFDEKVKALYKYLPYVDSWGITDSVAAAFKDVRKNREKATDFIYSLLKSPLTYSRRFGVVLLTLYFTGDNFKAEHIKNVLLLKTGEYYVDMAVAWYMSVLLIKNRDAAMEVIKARDLPTFIHDKAIQKATESFRISAEDKIYLKSYKIKNAR